MRRAQRFIQQKKRKSKDDEFFLDVTTFIYEEAEKRGVDPTDLEIEITADGFRVADPDEVWFDCCSCRQTGTANLNKDAEARVICEHCGSSLHIRGTKPGYAEATLLEDNP